MAKVFRMLEKMGLVYAEKDGPDGVLDAISPPGEPEVERAESAEPAEAPVVVRRVSLKQLDPALKESAQEACPEEFPFERVFQSAGIKDPEHGFTAYKLIEMMNAEEFRDLDRDTKAKVIAGVLRRLPSGAVTIDDIVEDAVARDRALDAFEGFLADRLAGSQREIAEKNRELQNEIDEVTRRNTEAIAANQARFEEERARFEAWRQRKLAEETRLYEAIEPFVQSNPVSRSPNHDDRPPQQGTE